MLKLNSQTKHIFHASALTDSVMMRGQMMSVSPSPIRAELLVKCLPLFDEMRELAKAQFSQKAPFILAAVDEYEVAIRELAGMCGGQITEDRRDGVGLCPACGNPIMKFCSNPKSQETKKDWIIFCRECDKPFMKAYEKLDSTEGFCTWAI